jgi:hypothetical protein
MSKTKLDPKKNIRNPEGDSSKGKKDEGGGKTIMPDERRKGEHPHK